MALELDYFFRCVYILCFCNWNVTDIYRICRSIVIGFFEANKLNDGKSRLTTSQLVINSQWIFYVFGRNHNPPTCAHILTIGLQAKFKGIM